MHTRNKMILADFAARPAGARHSETLVPLQRAPQLCPGTQPPEVVLSEQLIENALLLREVDASVRQGARFRRVRIHDAPRTGGPGHRATVVDQRRYPFHHDRVHMSQHDILKPSRLLPDDFDLVYSISTLEHVGLGTYGDNRAAGDAVAAVRHLWAKVRPGGRFFFTVPSGHPSQRESYRMYSPEKSPLCSRARQRSLFREGWQGGRLVRVIGGGHRPASI